MDQDTCVPFSQICFKNRFIYLLVFLLIMFAIAPLDEVLGRFGILNDLVTSTVLVLAIYSVSQKRLHTVIGVLLAVPMIVALWSDLVGEYSWLQITGRLCGIAFFVFLIVIILKFVLSQDEITRDLIAGAAIVYLSLAAMWSFAYKVIEMMHPGSFALPPGSSSPHGRSLPTLAGRSSDAPVHLCAPPIAYDWPVARGCSRPEHLHYDGLAGTHSRGPNWIARKRYPILRGQKPASDQRVLAPI